MLITAMAVLGITALMLYYGSEELRMPAKWLHLLVGLSGVVLFPAHAFMRLTSRDAADAHAKDRSTSAKQRDAAAISADEGST